MLKLGELNSRMKDFYDIYLLLKKNDFKRAVLSKSITRTLQQRNTNLSKNPDIFKQSFITTKQSQWGTFIKKTGLITVPDSFETIIREIEVFLKPVFSTERSVSIWHAGKGWQ